jgi:uncharacterized membrane protein YcjF (UPF0283 family)
MGPKVNIAAIATVAFFAGTSVSFFTFPLWVAFLISLAKDGSRADWFGFAGSVFGAVMVLIGAVIARFAVQEQIRADRLASDQKRVEEAEKAERQEEAAKQAATIVLTQTVHAAAAVLNVARGPVSWSN